MYIAIMLDSCHIANPESSGFVVDIDYRQYGVGGRVDPRGVVASSGSPRKDALGDLVRRMDAEILQVLRAPPAEFAAGLLLSLPGVLHKSAAMVELRDAQPDDVARAAEILSNAAEAFGGMVWRDAIYFSFADIQRAERVFGRLRVVGFPVCDADAVPFLQYAGASALWSWAVHAFRVLATQPEGVSSDVHDLVRRMLVQAGRHAFVSLRTVEIERQPAPAAELDLFQAAAPAGDDIALEADAQAESEKHLSGSDW